MYLRCVPITFYEETVKIILLYFDNIIILLEYYDKNIIPVIIILKRKCILSMPNI